VLQDASTWVMATRIVMMVAVLFYAVKALYAMKERSRIRFSGSVSETETITW
jgi:hypothetical protein